MAIGTGPHVLNAAEGGILGHAHLAGAAAGGAGLGLGAGLRAGAVAFRAFLVPHHVDLLFAALGRLFEGKGNIVTQIIPGHGAVAGGAVAAAGERGEYIVKIESAKAAAEAPEACAAEAGAALSRLRPVKAVLIVRGALLRIGKHLVGLVDLLKFFLGLRIARIDIGMPLFGQLPVCLFNGGFVGALVDAQHLVIIPFCQFEHLFRR